MLDSHLALVGMRATINITASSILPCRLSWSAGHFKETTVGELVDSVPELHSIAPNVLLALLWASLVCLQHWPALLALCTGQHTALQCTEVESCTIVAGLCSQ